LSITVFVVSRIYGPVIKKAPAKSGKMRAIAGENGSRKGQILGKTGQATL
jgi:hypothetical protein